MVKETTAEIGGVTVMMDRTTSVDSNVNSNSNSQRSVEHAEALVISFETAHNDSAKPVVNEVMTDGLISAPTMRPD